MCIGVEATGILGEEPQRHASNEQEATIRPGTHMPCGIHCKSLLRLTNSKVGTWCKAVGEVMRNGLQSPWYLARISGRGPVILNSSTRVSSGVVDVYLPHIAICSLGSSLSSSQGSEPTSIDSVPVPQGCQESHLLPPPQSSNYDLWLELTTP